jgi:hypothetical protein
LGSPTPVALHDHVSYATTPSSPVHNGNSTPELEGVLHMPVIAPPLLHTPVIAPPLVEEPTATEVKKRKRKMSVVSLQKPPLNSIESR